MPGQRGPGPFDERGAGRAPAQRLDADAAGAREQVEEARFRIRGVRMLNRLSLARSVIGRVAEVRGGRSTRPLALPAITLTGPSCPAGAHSWPP